MRIIQPPQSSNIQYVDNPELVQKLVEMQKKMDQLRLSQPRQQIKEVIVEKKIPDLAIQKEVIALRDQVKRYEDALRRKSGTSNAQQIVSTVDKVVYKLPRVFIAAYCGSSVLLLLAGLLVGKYILN